MTHVFKRVVPHWEIFFRAVRADIIVQHAGTALGLSWIIVGPLILLSLYTVIYAVVFNVRVTGLTQIEYVLNVFSGLVLFLAFAGSLSASTNSFTKDKQLIFSNFPVELIPAKAVVVAHVMILPATIVVVLGDFVFSTPSWHILLLPVVAFLQLFFAIGLGFFLSLLGLVLRDINFLIQYIVIALLVVTPIAYTPAMVPEGIKNLLYINPLFYFVSANQHFILMNSFPPVFEIAAGMLLPFVVFLAGLITLRRAKLAMVDFI